MNKIELLKKHFLLQWMLGRRIVFDELSDQQTMFCVCGKLATGLHESNCRRFNSKVDAATVKKLKHLIIKLK